jgi:hypothetical protein
MEQQHHRLTPEAATDEPASPVNPVLSEVEGPPASTPANAPPAGPEDFAFASEAEEDAYWAGVSDGMRNVGGVPCPRLAARARDCYPELVASAADLGGRPHPAELDFDPASTRHRTDGITPERQREYVEALADTGIARYAAARVGVSPQAINRLRRKPEAHSFDLACAAAQRIGARRVHDIGWERAIEGQIKRHYYHGQLAGEERVYDNKLLIYLMGRTEPLLDAPEEAPAIAANWTPWVEAMEQGADPPDLNPPQPEPEAERAVDPEDRLFDQLDGSECWEEEDGEIWTRFPPPAGFEGLEEGRPGAFGYKRTLSAAEQAVFDADDDEDEEEEAARGIALRDLYFGFAGGTPEDELFPLMEAETCETSERSPAPWDKP